MPEKRKKKRRPEEREKDEIFQLLTKEFAQDPSLFWSYWPNIADKMDKHVSPKKHERAFHFYLTERERDFYLNSLKAIVGKFQENGQVPKEEGIKALENAAALREHAAPYKDILLAVAEKALELPLESTEKRTIYFQKGKPEHHTYTLARGITLALTWDGKLIKLTVDPEELAHRQKALSFVGAGSDKKQDVARRHDFYFKRALWPVRK